MSQRYLHFEKFSDKIAIPADLVDRMNASVKFATKYGLRVLLLDTKDVDALFQCFTEAGINHGNKIRYAGLKVVDRHPNSDLPPDILRDRSVLSGLCVELADRVEAIMPFVPRSVLHVNSEFIGRAAKQFRNAGFDVKDGIFASDGEKSVELVAHNG